MPFNVHSRNWFCGASGHSPECDQINMGVMSEEGGGWYLINEQQKNGCKLSLLNLFINTSSIHFKWRHTQWIPQAIPDAAVALTMLKSMFTCHLDPLFVSSSGFVGALVL